jgi:hypothetical protein
MAVLTTKARKHIAPSNFAGPGRTFPIEDKAHARDALGRAKQSLDAGHISERTYKHIVAMADKELGETPKGAGH